MKSTWTLDEELKAQELLKSGKTYKETALILNRSWGSISNRNQCHWKIKVGEIGYSTKLSRAMLRISDKLSASKKGKWAGKNNPNYGAKIVKRGKDNPLSVWKSQNPGYQDGEKNPCFGRIPPKEETERRTKKLIEWNKYRTGKTQVEVYGEQKSKEISRAMSLGAVKRLSKKKFSNTVPEREMKKILEELKIPYEFQYPIEFYCVDFYIPSKNLVILVDGCYWHACPKHFTVLNSMQKSHLRTDHSCNSYLKNHGYDFIRIWECELPNSPKLDQIKLKLGIGG